MSEQLRFDNEARRSAGAESYADKGGHNRRHKISALARSRGEVPPQYAAIVEKYRYEQKQKAGRKK